MITDIHIQNFKLFKSFKLEKLPKILLVGGKNNSGIYTTCKSESEGKTISLNFKGVF